MKITNYCLDSNPEIGFSIQEDTNNKLSKISKSTVSLWKDPYEGGEAYDTDWEYINDFKSSEEAMQYINKNYGSVTKIAIY